MTTKVCKSCNAKVATDLSLCPHDGGILEPTGTDPLVATVLADKYEILRVSGRGGMSTVYKARHLLMNRIVAVKLLKEHLVSDPIAQGRFEREARAVSSLHHPNIITVFDFGVTPKGEAFLVMDWLEGPTLDELLVTDGHMNPLRAVRIFRQIAAGLEHAHAKNIIHRDLKPLNVCLITEANGTESARIVDYGLAKFVEHEEVSTEDVRALTRPGQICGSPLYMSPEQVRGKPLDQRSDLYSFGCLMYETLTGNPPFIGDTTFETMNKQVEEQPPAFPSILDVPQDLQAIVFQALKKDPTSRYQSASEMEKDLADFLARNTAVTSKPAQKNRALTIVLVCAALALVLAALVILSKH